VKRMVSGRSAAIYGFFIAAAISFTISAPSPDWLHVTQDNSDQTGLFYYCTDAPDHCTSYSTSDLSNCAQDKGNAVETFYGKTYCQSWLAAQAFSIMCIILSWVALLAFWRSKSKHKHGAGFAFAAVIFSIITISIFVTASSDLLDSSIQTAVKNNTVKFGYAFALQLVGLILEFLGGFACAFYASR